MRITLKKHGGFAAVRLPEQSVDVSSLDAPQGEKLRRLAEAALGAGPSERPSRAAPDAMSYSITIEDDGRSTTLWGSDASMTPTFAELLESLEELG